MFQLLLAVDTSGKNGSIALARVTRSQNEISVLEVVPLAGGAFSAELVPRIAALLNKHRYSASELEALAVVSGPGSFTGLRVGLAAIKALGEALGKPIVPVSMLEAIACRSGASGRVLALLDAGRGDVYAGDYELDPPIRMRSERLLSREALVAEAEGRWVVTPDPVLAAMIRVSAPGVQVEQMEHPDSGIIARLGWQHLQRGETVRPEDLEANYIRHSDAEIFSKPAS